MALERKEAFDITRPTKISNNCKVLKKGLYLYKCKIMPEIIIKYKSPKTLQALKDFAKYFDFVISSKKTKKTEELSIRGVTVIPGDSSIDISELEDIFTNKNIDAKSLRTEAWQRRK